MRHHLRGLTVSPSRVSLSLSRFIVGLLSRSVVSIVRSQYRGRGFFFCDGYYRRTICRGIFFVLRFWRLLRKHARRFPVLRDFSSLFFFFLTKHVNSSGSSCVCTPSVRFSRRLSMRHVRGEGKGGLNIRVHALAHVNLCIEDARGESSGRIREVSGARLVRAL